MKKIEEIAKEAGIEHKEIEEARYFHNQVKKVLSQRSVSYNLLNNFFCGNDLVTWFWLAENRHLYSVSYDLRRTNKSDRLREKVENNFPELALRNKFLEVDLTTSWPAEEDNKNSLTIAIHACGNLSDIFIRNCTDQRIPFAIAPCCHRKDLFVLTPKNYPLCKNYQESSFDLYQDMTRIQFAKEKKYSLEIRYLPEKITPKNRIIIGVPEENEDGTN